MSLRNILLHYEENLPQELIDLQMMYLTNLGSDDEYRHLIQHYTDLEYKYITQETIDKVKDIIDTNILDLSKEDINKLFEINNIQRRLQYSDFYPRVTTIFDKILGFIKRRYEGEILTHKQHLSHILHLNINLVNKRMIHKLKQLLHKEIRTSAYQNAEGWVEVYEKVNPENYYMYFLEELDYDPADFCYPVLLKILCKFIERAIERNNE